LGPKNKIQEKKLKAITTKIKLKKSIIKIVKQYKKQNMKKRFAFFNQYKRENRKIDAYFTDTHISKTNELIIQRRKH